MSNGQKPKLDRQREHQANERTFLAWLRTAIALIGFGFAIARFGLFLRELQTAVTGQESLPHTYLSSRYVGVGLVIVGILLIALATWEHQRVFRQIESGDYQPNRYLVWITATIVTILGILSIPLILWQQTANPKPTSHQLRRDVAQHRHK